jgi:hypothetical protein
MTYIYRFRSVPDVSMRIFNLFTIPLRKIRLRAFVTDINNQLTWKCIKNTCHAVFGLNVAVRLVDNALYVKLTENEVRIILKRIFMYFPWFFINISPPPLLHSSQNSTFIGEMVIFVIIENIQMHHCISLILILPFEIGFALSGICCLRKCDFVTFSRNMLFLKEVSIV